MDIDLKQLKELMRSLKQFDIAELELEKNGERIKLCRSGNDVVSHALSAPPPAIMASLPASAPGEKSCSLVRSGKEVVHPEKPLAKEKMGLDTGLALPPPGPE